METQVKLTKLATCAGCGAKMGAGTLAQMLEGFKTHADPRLVVGYDKSDDASVYVLSEDLALIQTTDFFPPIVDDPYLYGKIAATNALSDVYAMGGEPKLALNILCAAESMEDKTIREILRGGYDAAYDAGAIITGGHTIKGAEPIYGLAVSGFVRPDKVLTNSGARPGDVLLLTKPLGGDPHHRRQGRDGRRRRDGSDLPADGHPQQGGPGCHGEVPGPQLHRCHWFRPAGPQL